MIAALFITFAAESVPFSPLLNNSDYGKHLEQHLS
jgi:hypothetical protein